MLNNFQQFWPMSANNVDQCWTTPWWVSFLTSDHFHPAAMTAFYIVLCSAIFTHCHKLFQWKGGLDIRHHFFVFKGRYNSLDSMLIKKWQRTKSDSLVRLAKAALQKLSGKSSLSFVLDDQFCPWWQLLKDRPHPRAEPKPLLCSRPVWFHWVSQTLIILYNQISKS